MGEGGAGGEGGEGEKGEKGEKEAANQSEYRGKYEKNCKSEQYFTCIYINGSLVT